MVKDKEKIVKEARELIDGLEDYMDNEGEFFEKLNSTLNNWKEAQAMENLDTKMIPLTVDEVAEVLKVKPRVVSDLLKKGIIKGGKVGKQWRILQGDLEEYLKKMTSGE